MFADLERAMPTFKLFNLESLRLEEFLLEHHPPYLAASHTWREHVFDVEQGFRNCFGGRGIQAVIDQADSGIHIAGLILYV